MNQKKVIVFICFVLITSTLTYCLQSKNNNTLNRHLGSKNAHNIELTLSRGAFHGDAFQLIGNELTHLTNKPENIKINSEYDKNSTVILSDSIINSLVQEINEDHILELDTLYKSNFSCNSMLRVNIKIDTIEKTIFCEDYIRGCPDKLSDLETKLIRLHGKNLKRIYLPG
ncbi:hypothetical protein [Aquimarina algicola]|uniref:Uncharacterized protein n=1 Tax=Aquimarina algicola TaxID=2589995 RepID=A0A504JKG9_9FLAO|nr:hypothetical protein [Aquimarina algicola]TPN86980.1 hypothetical protein FHK87_05140 [Aquimarina algicola]